MVQLKKCECGSGLPAVRYRRAPDTAEGETLTCRPCALFPSVPMELAPGAVVQFVQTVQHLCTLLRYLGTSADGVPMLLADPQLHKGNDRLDLYLFPRYRMYEERDKETGRLIMRADKNYRRIRLQNGNPLDLYKVPYG